MHNKEYLVLYSLYLLSQGSDLSICVPNVEKRLWYLLFYRWSRESRRNLAFVASGRDKVLSRPRIQRCHTKMIDRVESSNDRVRNKTSQNGVIQPLLTGKMAVKCRSFFTLMVWSLWSWYTSWLVQVNFFLFLFTIDRMKVLNMTCLLCQWWFQ